MSHLRKQPARGQSAQPEANTARNGGASTQPLTKLVKADLIKDSTSRIKTREEALRFLRSKEVLLEEEEVTVGALSMALLYLVRGTILVPAVLVDGMRAVAICMEGLGDETAARARVNESKEVIEGFLVEARKVVEGIAMEAARAVKVMQVEVARGVAERNAVPASQSIAQGGGNAADSYAAALMFGPGATAASNEAGRTHQALMAREDMRSRQVLVDGIEGVKQATVGLTPKMIVEKANLALAAMGSEEGEWGVDTRPLDAKFITAKVLANKGVVLEMETVEAAEWIRGAEARKAFERNFGGSAEIRDRLYQLVVEFVPASLKEALPNVRSYVERDNTLATGSLLAMRWLRDTKHWKEAQRAGHAVVTLRNRDTSNKIVKKGLIMEGQRLEVRKLEEDPKRCYNCQLVNAGHIASKCPTKEVVCPNCAGAHVGGECRVLRAEYRCASCAKEGLEHNHAAWDRNCPVFLQEKRRLRELHPENNYKYFPTAEEWTWERHEEAEQLGEHQRLRGRGRDHVKEKGPGVGMQRPDAGWKGPLGSAAPGGRSGTGGRDMQPPKSMPMGTVQPGSSQPAANAAQPREAERRRTPTAPAASRQRPSVSRGRGGMNGGWAVDTSGSRVRQSMVDTFFGRGLSQTGSSQGTTQGDAPSL